MFTALSTGRAVLRMRGPGRSVAAGEGSQIPTTDVSLPLSLTFEWTAWHPCYIARLHGRRSAGILHFYDSVPPLTRHGIIKCECNTGSLVGNDTCRSILLENERYR